jgi:hypothetical protein
VKEQVNAGSRILHNLLMTRGLRRPADILYQAAHRVTHEDRVWFSERLQTCGEIHRVAKDSDSCVCTILHFPDYRRPGVEPDARWFAVAMFRFEVCSRCLS